MSKHQPLTALPISERPRERLQQYGVDQLTTAELIALIISTGTRTENVLQLSRRILRSFTSLADLSAGSAQQLKKIKGLGEVKTSQLLASFELGRRTFQDHFVQPILSASDVLPLVTTLRHSSREQLIALYLNARHELIKKTTLAMGSFNQTIIHPRDVFNEAVQLPCLGIILVHNHPSGNTTPSQDDLTLTQNIAQAGKLLGITLIDHLIVSSSQYTSFKEKGLI